MTYGPTNTPTETGTSEGFGREALRQLQLLYATISVPVQHDGKLDYATDAALTKLVGASWRNVPWQQILNNAHTYVRLKAEGKWKLDIENLGKPLDVRLVIGVGVGLVALYFLTRGR